MSSANSEVDKKLADAEACRDYDSSSDEGDDGNLMDEDAAMKRIAQLQDRKLQLMQECEDRIKEIADIDDEMDKLDVVAGTEMGPVGRFTMWLRMLWYFLVKLVIHFFGLG
jgi:hypothetical protein